MTAKNAIALLAVAWLLAGCASFGEGLARGVLARSNEPAGVQSEVPAYCRPDGADFANRLFQRPNCSRSAIRTTS
jgi:hypothetical protein